MPLKLIVAPQEFKGSLTARQAAVAMAAGVRRAAPDAFIDEIPLADGGPGFVDALVSASDGSFRSVPVLNPVGRTVEASFGLIDGGQTAVLEMAAASGLSLLPHNEFDPCHASTYGTGQLIRAALDLSAHTVLIGLGGSATNDGGAGMARALGIRFLDGHDEELDAGGVALLQLDRIDVTGLDKRVAQTRFLAASDVGNPLCGPSGASRIFGPQKGATPEMVARLDDALARFAAVIWRDVGVDILELPGAGAAGGLGAGLVAFLAARLQPGFPLVADATKLSQRLENADLVLTGEGRLDAQTAYGKTLAGLATLTAEAGVPLVALAGTLGEGYTPVVKNGITAALSIIPAPMGLDDACANATEYLAASTRAVVQIFLAGRQPLRRAGPTEGS